MMRRPEQAQPTPESQAIVSAPAIWRETIGFGVLALTGTLLILL